VPDEISRLNSPQQTSTRLILLLLASLFAGLLLIELSSPHVPPSPHYLSWHQLLETLSIVVSTLIFAVGWNTYRLHRQRNILVVSCAFLGVAIADFSHMLSYRGMPDFITPNGIEKGINFWLLARYLAALALLLVAWLPWRPADKDGAANTGAWRLLCMLGMFLLLVPAHIIFFWFPQWVPQTFIEGQGLTAFKVASEYGVIAIHLLSIALLARHLRRRTGVDVRLLMGALLAMIMSELLFTRYSSVTDLYNLGGHLYKVMAYLVLYRVMFVETIYAPYRALDKTRKHTQAVIEAIPDQLFELDGQGRCLSVHTPPQGALIDPRNSPPGCNLLEVLPAEAADNCQRALEEARLQGFSIGQQLLISQGEQTRCYELSVSTLHQGPNTSFVMLARDISQRLRDQQHIEYLAHFDALTSLPNRTLFASRVEQALILCERSQQTLAVLFMDLDHFKNINDLLGHPVGDALLVEVARRIQPLIRDEDTFSRQGGDEFILVLPYVDAQGAAHLARHIQSLLDQPFRIDTHNQQISASIGIAMFPEDGSTVETLARHAEIAMYRAKQDGRNQHAFFTQEMQAQSARTLQLESALRNALSQGELEVYYQPQLSVDGQLVGAEALLRWKHPELGFISPAEFIPIAESSGQILRIGEWVLRTACAQMQRWLEAGYPAHTTMAVNLSMAQFRAQGLLKLIADVLQQSGLPAHCLELELTESVAMHKPASVVQMIRELRKLGVRLAIDDFGTGYSSLSYLKQLEVHKLKIDQSFVHDINRDGSDQRIVQAIIGMAHGLGMLTIAEGVETSEQLQQLTLMGCQEVQGYLFSRPLPAAEFDALVRGKGLLPMTSQA
jgi:diguanylate cyclase (GGDEF)-like protein